jgi:4-amino-4-deoxy-L-arabinose transferase-like glycosyltransferase
MKNFEFSSLPFNSSKSIFYILNSSFYILLVGFFLRLYALDQESLWYDELLQLDIAQGPLRAVLPALPLHAAVPLDYLLTHFWIMLGRQDFWVRLPAVFLGTLTLPLAYQLGRRLVGSTEGVLLMALLTLSPFHVRYSQETRPYALLVLGVVLAALAFWRLRSTGRWPYAALLLAGGLIFSMSHFFATVLFLPWGIFAALDVAFQRRRASRLALGTLMATGALVLAILLALGWGQTLFKVSSLFGDTILQPEKFVAEAEEKPNNNPGPRVDWNFVKYQVVAPLGAGGTPRQLILGNGLAGLGLAYLLAKRRFKLVAWLSLWLVLPMVSVVAFLLHRGEFFESRYIISTLPAYLILLTVGLLALPRWVTRAGLRQGSLLAFVLVGGLVLFELSAGLKQMYNFQEKENWRLVSRFLAQNAKAGEPIIAVNAESTLNWYYQPGLAAPNSYDSLAEIEDTVLSASRSWVVVSIFTEYLGPEDDRIKAWLSEQGAVRLDLDPLIFVYYLGPGTAPEQLLAEIRQFALPVDHHLYASLARENRRDPLVARQYYQLAIDHAPDEATRAEYESASVSLGH